MRTRYKPTETFQYTNYNSCHPAGVKKGFVKGEALRLLRTSSTKVVFEENIKNFKTRLASRGCPSNLVDKILSEVNFAERKNALTQEPKAYKKILPFVTQFQPSLPCLKNILMEKRHLTLSLPWEMSYFCKTATVNPYTNCNTPIKRFYLGHCINHSG